MSDLEITQNQDFDMEEIDDMPSFVEQIDGVYECKLSLSRDSGERKEKPYDNIIFQFTIVEEKEAKKDHGVAVDDIVTLRYSTLRSPKDEQEKKKDSYGLRLAKPYLLAIKNELDTSSSLNDIISNAQDLTCTATFATKTTKTKDQEDNEVIYHNINLKNLVLA